MQEQGFLDALKELLSDSNPMVVANAVAALSEIGRDDFLNKGVVNKLLTALNECTEWGQIFILDAVAEYIPSDNREAQVRPSCEFRNQNFPKITLQKSFSRL